MSSPYPQPQTHQMTSLSSDSSLVDGLSLCGEVVWPLTTGVSLQSLLTMGAYHTSLPMAGPCLYRSLECLPSPLMLGA